jgi:hypothetical protein
VAQFRLAWLIRKSKRRQTPIRDLSAKGMRANNKVKAKSMWRVIRLLVLIILLGVLGLIGYSYSGYLLPAQQGVTEPVQLNVD